MYYYNYLRLLIRSEKKAFNLKIDYRVKVDFGDNRQDLLKGKNIATSFGRTQDLNLLISFYNLE